MSIPTSGGFGLSTLNLEVGRAATTPVTISDPSFSVLRGTTANPKLMSAWRGKTRFLLTAGVKPSDGTTIGYAAGSYGSLSPASDSRFTITSITGPFGGHSSLELRVAGGWVQSSFAALVIGGVAFPTASASFSGGATGIWSWGINPNLSNGGVYEVYLN